MSEPVKKQLYVSPAPHFVEGISTRFLMCMLILALLPETIYGVMLFGFRALLVVLVSVAGSVVFEAAFQKLTKQNITVSDCSAVVTGLLLALVLPPTVPLWQVLLGDLFAIVVAKGFFGGLGANVWNPALTGRAFLFVSFSAAIGAAWLAPGTDAISAATVLSKLKEGAAGNAGAYLESFLGNTAGCIGETNELLILISFAFLALTQVACACYDGRDGRSFDLRFRRRRRHGAHIGRPAFRCDFYGHRLRDDAGFKSRPRGVRCGLRTSYVFNKKIRRLSRRRYVFDFIYEFAFEFS